MLVYEQPGMHAVKSRTFTTPSSVQTLTHTHQKRLTRLTHSTYSTRHSWNTFGGDSEFSVNMHALWLKHLNFPLVPYHTVLHSACSSNRLIGPIISFGNFGFDKWPQNSKHIPDCGEGNKMITLPFLHIFDTHTHTRALSDQRKGDEQRHKH